MREKLDTKFAAHTELIKAYLRMYWEHKVNKDVRISDFQSLSVTDDAMDRQRRTKVELKIDEFFDFSTILSEGVAKFLKY